MSDTVDNLAKSIKDTVEKVEDFSRKKQAIEEAQINAKHKRLVESQEQLKKIESIDITQRDPLLIEKHQKNSTEYLNNIKKSKTFINDDFIGKIPYFEKNIILVAAETGDGKSTTSANLALHAVTQNQRVLIITNEESVVDVYNRVTCMIQGWSYSNHEKFTQSQISIFEKFIGILSHRMTVVDDSFNNGMNQTTTIEGIESILTSIRHKKDKFDVIIFDYYQNIDRSIEAPSLVNWQVQEMFCKLINKFKDIYPAPIVVLAQLKPNSNDLPFKESIEGRKVILNVATSAIKVEADRENLRTGWTVKKTRFPESMGETIYTGFKKGRYVKYDQKFREYIENIKEERKHRATMSRIAMTNYSTERESE